MDEKNKKAPLENKDKNKSVEFSEEFIRIKEFYDSRL